MKKIKVYLSEDSFSSRQVKICTKFGLKEGKTQEIELDAFFLFIKKSVEPVVISYSKIRDLYELNHPYEY